MDTQSVVAVFTLAGTIVVSTTALLREMRKGQLARDARAASEQAAAVNDAVNHRHPEHPRMFDMVDDSLKMIMSLYEKEGQHTAMLDELIAWRRSYTGGRWDNGDKVEQWIRKFEADQQEHKETHQRIEGKIHELFELTRNCK